MYKILIQKVIINYSCEVKRSNKMEVQWVDLLRCISQLHVVLTGSCSHSQYYLLVLLIFI